MTEPSPDSPTTAAPAARERRSVWWVALPTLAFLLGLALGAVVIAVGQDDAPATDDAAAPNPTTDTTTATPSPGATVVVPDQCIEAADTVEEATGVIRQGAEAVRDLRARELVDLLNQLEDLDARAREQAQACRGVDVSVTEPTGSATPSEAPQPTE